MEQKQEQTAENTSLQSVSQVIQSQIALARFRMDECNMGDTDWVSYSNEIFVLNSLLPSVLAAEAQASQQTASLQQQVKELKEENERLKKENESPYYDGFKKGYQLNEARIAILEKTLNEVRRHGIIEKEGYESVLRTIDSALNSNNENIGDVTQSCTRPNCDCLAKAADQDSQGNPVA